MSTHNAIWSPCNTLPISTDFSDKTRAVSQYVSYMLNRTQSMFKYENLPETLPQRELEIMLQTNGFVAIPIPSKVSAVKGNIYAFAEGAFLGGKRNVYYMPTICTISSPALDWSENLNIGDECIIVPNDSLYIGLLPMFSRYASLLAENDISMRLANINSRLISLICAPDDRSKKSAEMLIKDIERGNIAVLGDNPFLDGVKTQPYASNSRGNTITQLIEFQQYLKAGWFNDIGLNANYNMKREAINSGEAELNDDALLPLALDMLRMRREGFERVNKACGTNIKVELANVWKARENDMLTQQLTEPEQAQEQSEHFNADENMKEVIEDAPTD